jgi:hypothetical protein
MGSSKHIGKEIEFDIVLEPEGGEVSYEYDSRDETEVRALVGQMGGAPAAEPARMRFGAADLILVDYAGAAELLGTTVSALKTRVSRGDARLHAAMVTNGRRVRFNVAKLSEKFTPKRSP